MCIHAIYIYHLYVYILHVFMYKYTILALFHGWRCHPLFSIARNSKCITWILIRLGLSFCGETSGGWCVFFLLVGWGGKMTTKQISGFREGSVDRIILV